MVEIEGDIVKISHGLNLQLIYMSSILDQKHDGRRQGSNKDLLIVSRASISRIKHILY